MNYSFHPKARIEHLEHVNYYETQRPGLGGRYLAAFTLTMGKICANPLRYKIAYQPDIRSYRVSGFPFTVLYRQSGKNIVVLAITHHRRRPDYWVDRI